MRLLKFIAIIGFALLTTLALPAQTVRVIFTSGSASIQRPDETSPRAIVKGESVIIGTRIITGADGRVVLTPMPGVKSIVAPNTTLTLESSSESKTSETNVTHQAVIDLKEGAIVSDLKKPEGVTYDYSIRTARGLAGARGTTFTVGINAAGIQTIVVAHGTISLNFADGRQVSLAIGSLSITPPAGETKSVSSVNELTPSEKAIAQNWVETTVGAIASALEAGVEVDIEALKNALAAAESLGIKLPPDLQALVDRVLALLAPAKTETDTKTVTDVVAEESAVTGFTSIASYRATLTPEQASAFKSLRNDKDDKRVNSQFIDEGGDEPTTDNPGGYSDKQLLFLLRDAKLATGLTNLLNLYVEFKAELDLSDNSITSFLTNLGILGQDNFTAVGADTVGLRTLVLAYYQSENYFVDQYNEADFPRGNTAEPVFGYEIFFPGKNFNNGGKGVTIHDATFENDSDHLRIGATRNLLLDNVTINTGEIRGAPAYRTGLVELRASDLVSLNNTRFGDGIGRILIAATTINLANVTFNKGTSIKLYPKFGEANFGSSKLGHVNFIKNVNYGTGETRIKITNQAALDMTPIQLGTLEQSLPNND